MMPINYICIDDESSTDVDPLLKSVCETTGELKIDRHKPVEIGKQVDFIKSKDPDGLILDLRLDQQKNEEGYKVPYHGLALAQELRTRMTEKRLNSFPIVLWSVDSKFKDSYDRDSTSHNLFDKIYVKDTEFTHEPARVASELVALVKGYLKIIKGQEPVKGHFQRILGLAEGASDTWDPRIGEKFLSQYKYPPHEYARYILRELIEVQGPLIDENVLAARLGVEQEISVDWGKCKLLFTGCYYKGAFCEAWPRWWAAEVDKWWTFQTKAPGPLRRLSAEERVEFLKTKLKSKGLVAAKPIEEGYSTRFWTICQGLEKPLDPIDGLRSSCAELKAWQDPPFLSIKAALERIGRDRRVVVHPLERERLAEIKTERRKHGE
ncbi:MAG: hypothetical protein HYS23_08710 [Geobacter sp.]|nr:hypothetical protein [Geobacter sp.]